MPRVTLTIPGRPPQPYRFELDRRVVSFGRGPENDIVIDSGSVSTKHAEMIRTGSSYEIRDLGSTNGTKLDGERHFAIPLASGMVVQLGDVDFEFQLSDEEQLELTGARAPLLQAAGATPAIAPAAPPVAILIEDEPEVPTGMSFTMKLLLFLIIVLALLLGLSLRHQKETGKTLADEFLKPAPQAEQPAPAPAPEAPAKAP
jgi:pSer/pThr/pTyr-binding forkhead associated (FHA) protein